MKFMQLARMWSRPVVASFLLVPGAVAATGLPLAVVVPMPEPGVVGLLAVDLAAVGGLLFVLRRRGRNKQ